MSALDLRDTQGWFATAITTGETVDEGIANAERAGSVARAEDVVTPGPRMSARERLGVYHHAYRARLVECLADDYPAVQYALGHEAFERLCHEYVAVHASTTFSLNFYGAKVPGFCRTRDEPWCLFASELAALEWAIVEAIHAPSGPSARPFAQVPVDDWSVRRLVPSATLRIVRSGYPVNSYYQAFRDGAAPPSHPLPEPRVTAVTRGDMTVWRMNIPTALVPVLDALVAGTPLGDALEVSDASEIEITAAFRDWVSTGVFVGVE